jgi:hypothetical protein
MQDKKSIPTDLATGQNEPIELQEQLASSHWFSHRTEWTNRRQDQDNQHDPEKGCICASLEKKKKNRSGKGVVGE